MSGTPWPHGDPLAVARAILRQPRYRVAAQPAPARGWWERLLGWFGSLWDRLIAPLHHIRGGERIADVVGTLVLVAVVCALAAVAVRYARRRSRAVRPPAAYAVRALDETSDAAALRARAREAAAEGRHRDAAALLWASALRALDEHGRVRYDASRTPGEWRRAVRDPDFDVLARDAVVALFAGDAGPALVARMNDAYDRMLSA